MVNALILTTEEAAEQAGVDPSVIRKWVMRGDLEPLRRDVRPLRFRYDDVARVQYAKRSKAWRRAHETARAEWVASE